MCAGKSRMAGTVKAEGRMEFLNSMKLAIAEAAISVSLVSFGYSYWDTKTYRDLSGNEWEYAVAESGDAAVLVGGHLASSDPSRPLELPSQVDGLPVVEISGRYGYGGIDIWPRWYESLVIPGTVTNIADYAFSRSSFWLTSVEIESSDITIGDYAFEGASALVSVFCNGRVRKLGRWAFGSCRDLVCFSALGDVVEIGDSAFSGDKSLSTFLVLGGVSKIGANAFSGCSRLRQLRISKDTLQSIGAGAFNGCTGFSADENGVRYEGPYKRVITGHDSSLSGDIVIPESVVMICSEAFADAKNARSIWVPSSVRSISYGAFQGCAAKVLVDSDNIDYLSGGSGELLNKSGTMLMFVPAGVTSYAIPSSVRSIAKYAFYGCDKLSMLHLPETVNSIDEMAFMDCAPVFLVSGLSAGYSSDGQGCLYDKSKTKILNVPNVLSGVTIPASVSEIGSYACYKNPNLTELVIPRSVSRIGRHAFFRCDSLRSVRLNEGLLRIGEDAFYGCKSLTELVLPEGLIEVGGYAFTECGKLASVRFPASVEKIGTYAFGNTAIEKLKIATSGNLDIGTWAFMNCSRLNDVDIKAKTIETHWTFDDCVNLRMVTLEADSIALGTWTFMGCSSLRTVHIFGQNRTSDSTDVYNGCPSDLVTYVLQGTAGWGDSDGALPASWLGRAIRYYIEPSPIPDLGVNPTTAAVANALQGSCDARLIERITNGVEYAAYREWAGTVKTADGLAAAGFQCVKDSPNAWLSFVLDSERLIENAPVDDDLKVDEFKPAETGGSFDFTVSIADVRVGDGATADNLAKVLGIEGAEVLDAAKFSRSNVEVSVCTPKNGKIRFRVSPKGMGEATFFMRAKIKP